MTYQHLNVEEREEIQAGLWRKESVRSIAKRLGRSPASISREITKNLPLQRQYRPRLAHERALARRKERGRKLRLKNQKGECIFRPKGPSIDDRPTIVEKRKRIGDWEGDSIASKDHAPGLNSLVDRTSGLLLLSKLSARTSKATRIVVAKRLESLPAHTLTVDNGTENQEWQETESDTGAKVYFAHPYHSWERGTNENTNGLVRWYFPKGTDFRKVSPEAIARVEYALNTRPRKRFGYLTPLEVFNQSVALAG